MRNEEINREFKKLLRQKEVRKIHVLVKRSCCVRYFDIGTRNNYVILLVLKRFCVLNTNCRVKKILKVFAEVNSVLLGYWKFMSEIL